MPYIPPKDRKPVDELIDQLAERIAKEAKELGNERETFIGLLNYTCTRLVLKTTRTLFGKIRYWIVDAWDGLFGNMAKEFYRRLGAPYEDKQIEKNGDVDLFKEYEDEIKKG